MNWFYNKLSLVLFAGLALLTAAIYWPGLYGGFILDDFPNLALLSMLPADASVSQMLNLSTNGIASELGRPLSLLSFLLQATSWPNDPFSFKLVNLFIHIINGGLLLLFFTLVFRANTKLAFKPIYLMALLALWLLHPINVSSVLYVVQRMNLLASMFVLLGLVSYLWCRIRFIESGGRGYFAAAILSPSLMFVLGVLSKENGALLYLFLAAMEVTLLDDSRTSSKAGKLSQLAVFLPLGLGLLAFVFYVPGVLEAYQQKPFTMIERSLSQFPVLLTYLSNILFPFPDRFGLFHDDFPVYGSVANLTVVFSVAVVLFLFGAAIRMRKSQPVLSFAVLWFFAGHALESSILPLELYFEHRNYLPAVGVLFGLIWLLQKGEALFTGTERIVTRSFTVIFLCWFGTITVLESFLWGDSVTQAYVEVERHPDSYRASTHLVQTVTSSGDPESGYELHRQLMGSDSHRIGDYLRWLEFGCILQNLELPAQNELQAVAADAPMEFTAIAQLNRLLPAVLNGSCPGSLLPGLVVVIEALLQNENFSFSRADLLYALATVYAAQGDLTRATELGEQSFTLRPGISTGLVQLNWLIELGDLAGARVLLQQFESEFAFEIASREGLRIQLSAISERLN
jgi:hypothetical protein